MDEFRRVTLLQLIKYLKSLDADVICLQEVLYYQFNMMKLILKMDGVFAIHVHNKKMKFGICILSKEKIIKSNHILLTSKKEQLIQEFNDKKQAIFTLAWNMILEAPVSKLEDYRNSLITWLKNRIEAIETNKSNREI